MIFIFFWEKNSILVLQKNWGSNHPMEKKTDFFAFFGPNTAFGRSCVVCPWRLGQWHFASRL
jgi:hypothetical protein